MRGDSQGGFVRNRKEGSGLCVRTLFSCLTCFLKPERKMLPAVAHRSPQGGEMAEARAERDQPQKITTYVNQLGESLWHTSISPGWGWGDCVVTPTPCTEQLALCQEHPRNPTAVPTAYFLFSSWDRFYLGLELSLERKQLKPWELGIKIQPSSLGKKLYILVGDFIKWNDSHAISHICYHSFQT